MASLLYDSDTGDASAASEFIARLLNGATAIHMHHLMVTGAGSFARHMALGVYDDLTEATDKLAEAYIGCTGTPLVFKGGTVTMNPDCVAEVKALYEYVETARGAMGTESHIQNEVDGIATILSGALYKLTRLS
jgi:DNA-binding ferritin-like protein